MGGVAHLVEQDLCKVKVAGSSPVTSTITIYRGVGKWKPAWLITKRSQVQILPPQPITGSIVYRLVFHTVTVGRRVRFPFGPPRAYPSHERAVGVAQTPTFWRQERACTTGSNPVWVPRLPDARRV